MQIPTDTLPYPVGCRGHQFGQKLCIVLSLSALVPKWETQIGTRHGPLVVRLRYNRDSLHSNWDSKKCDKLSSFGFKLCS